MAEPESVRFASQRMSLHYTAWGDPGAPPVILIHGGRDHGRMWDWTARVLASGGRRVIVPDLRGHGDSDWTADGAYDIGDFVCDLAELVDHLGAPALRIVGHSFGGNIAVRYTGAFPERVEKLVVIEGLDPVARPEREASADWRLLLWREWIAERRATLARTPHVYPDLAAATARMRGANARLSEEQVAHLTRHGVRARDGGVSFKFDPAFRNRSPVDFTHAELHALWGRIACPLLLIYGSESWASNPAADGRLARFRDARLEVIEGAGHWLQHDRFDRFIALVEDFLGAG